MKKAVVFGVNEYKTQKDLRGCINDAQEMHSILKDTFQFNEIAILTNADVSKATIIDEIQKVLAPDDGETDGCRLVFFAGHGGRIIDTDGDEIEGIDENICMPNYDWSNQDSYVLDDTLAILLKNAHEAAPFLRIYVVLDSCHSGTATRNTISSWDKVDAYALKTLGLKFVANHGWPLSDEKVSLLSVSREATEPEEINEILSKSTNNNCKASPIGFGLDGDEPTSHLLFSGCSASQTCKDVPLDGGYHGLFTYLLTRFAKSNPSSTWAEMHTSVSDMIAEGFGQTPQLEGPDSLKQRPIFS